MKLKSVPQQYSQTIFEVTSLPDYQRYVASKSGFFQITDDGNPNMIHAVDCSHYRHGSGGEEDFEEKVVRNKRKNGQYFYSKSLQDLKNWLKADRCGG